MHISLIIPAAAEEPSLPYLLEDLQAAKWNSEIIVCGAVTLLEDYKHIKWVPSTKGRAASLNGGAKHARAEFLWFLHADSRLSQKTIKTVKAFASTSPNSIGYCDLRYHDGTALMRLTELGVWLRCRIANIPFGDQGLCMSRKTFDALGGYDEKNEYGEDHLLILNAKQQSTPIKPIGASLSTSARKYQKHGWLKTTWQHQRLGWKQFFEHRRKP